MLLLNLLHYLIFFKGVFTAESAIVFSESSPSLLDVSVFIFPKFLKSALGFGGLISKRVEEDGKDYFLPFMDFLKSKLQQTQQLNVVDVPSVDVVDVLPPQFVPIHSQLLPQQLPIPKTSTHKLPSTFHLLIIFVLFFFAGFYLFLFQNSLS